MRKKNWIPHLKGNNFDEAFKNALGIKNPSRLKASLDANHPKKKDNGNKKENSRLY